MMFSPRQLICILLVLVGFLFVAHDEGSKSASAPRKTIITHSGAATVKVSEFEYIEISNSCGPFYRGNCMHVRSGPSYDHDSLYRLQNGMVFKVKEKIETPSGLWYKVYFDEWVRYPERVKGEWYISANAGTIVTDKGNQTFTASSSPLTSKKIVIDLGEQMIYAYDKGSLFMRTKMSSGAESHPTPVGTFSVFKKMPSRYMQGPLPGMTRSWDHPGVPWNLYFTEDGAAIHGSYWHDWFGTEQSSGCINLPPELAKIIYQWADLGTVVVVQN